MQARNWGPGNVALLPMPDCGDEQAQIALSSYLDGEADAEERALVEWHLASCRACHLVLAAWSQDSSRLRQALHDPQAAYKAQAIADQTRDWLAAQFSRENTRAITAIGPSRPRTRPVPARSSWRLVFSGLAATLVIIAGVLGASFSALPPSDYPSAAPTSSGEVAGTQAVTILRLQPQIAATPSIARRAVAPAAFMGPSLPPQPVLIAPTPALGNYPRAIGSSAGTLVATPSQRD